MKFRKPILILLIFILFIHFICNTTFPVYAGVMQKSGYINQPSIQPFTKASMKASMQTSIDTSTAPLHARYAALIDGSSKRLLYGKSPDTQVPNASTTKIMTLITALEICSDDYIVTTSSYAASMPDVQLNAVKGEQFIIKDLYYSLMLRSHNDTAVIIAENAAYYYICKLSEKERNELSCDLSFINCYNSDSSFIKDLTKEQSRLLVGIFTELMNKKAIELNCTNTHFVTPNGLDAADESGVHSTTAYELGIIMSYCINNNEFLDITQTRSYSFHNLANTTYTVTNANAFLSMYDNIISGKTGFTADAGYCYVCAYKDNENIFIVTLLACGWPGNKTYKWADARALLDYARNNYRQNIIIDNTKNFNINVINGKHNTIDICFDEKYSTALKDSDNVNVEYNIPESLYAPVKNGDVIGNVTIFINNEAVKQYPIICNKNIDKISVWDKISDFLHARCFFMNFNGKIMTYLSKYCILI